MNMRTIAISLLGVMLFAGCVRQEKISASATPKAQARAEIPKYLIDRPSELYARDGDKIVNAPAEDLAVARRYAEFPEKGKLSNGQRITIMTAKSTYRVGEEIRGIHILEAPEPGHEIHVMGPKPIENEFVDGKLASPERTGLAGYDGRVSKSPGVDFNYEVSTYVFNTSGEHTIQWKGGGHPIEGDLKLESNILRIMIRQ